MARFSRISYQLLPYIISTFKAYLLIVDQGIKYKVENKGQYEEYLQELEPIREELGIPLKEAMYPEEK